MKDNVKVYLLPLGCAKNLCNAELMLGHLVNAGMELLETPEGADVAIVNTCGFIDSAVQESLEAIGEALNENGKVIVTGCLGAKEEITEKNMQDVLEVRKALEELSIELA